MPVNHGPDISTWNEVQRYEDLRIPNYEFIATQVGVTARDGWRDKNLLVVDNQYRRNIDKFRELNIAKKILHYYVGINAPWKIQLDWLLKTMGPIPSGEGLMFDNEYGHLKELGWPSVKAMMDDAEQVLQRKVIHYGELFMHLDTAARLKCGASYQNSEAVMRNRYPYANVVLWQFTRTARVPGIAANCDMNQIMDFGAFNQAFGKAGDDMYWQALPQGVATFRVGGGTCVWLDGSAGPPAELVGKTVEKVGLAAFKKLILVGPLPVGDGLHQWTAADFMTTINGPIVVTQPPVVIPKHTHTARLVMEENT